MIRKLQENVNLRETICKWENNFKCAVCAFLLVYNYILNKVLLSRSHSSIIISTERSFFINSVFYNCIGDQIDFERHKEYSHDYEYYIIKYIIRRFLFDGKQNQIIWKQLHYDASINLF